MIVPLKYLSNFWRNLNIPLINCEVELILRWSEKCVLTSKATRDANPDANPPVAATNNPKNAVLKSEFKRTIKWNKYRSQMSIQNNK